MGFYCKCSNRIENKDNDYIQLVITQLHIKTTDEMCLRCLAEVLKERKRIMGETRGK
jgi:hypothetical protein